LGLEIYTISLALSYSGRSAQLDTMICLTGNGQFECPRRCIHIAGTWRHHRLILPPKMTKTPTRTLMCHT